jgi:hypothetical protein
MNKTEFISTFPKTVSIESDYSTIDLMKKDDVIIVIESGLFFDWYEKNYALETVKDYYDPGAYHGHGQHADRIRNWEDLRDSFDNDQTDFRNKVIEFISELPEMNIDKDELLIERDGLLQSTKTISLIELKKLIHDTDVV